MRIGINGSNLIAGRRPLAEIGEHAAEAEAAGFQSYWLAQLSAPDALTAIAVTGGQTTTIELGTAVVPTWTRHPMMLAAQALTVQEATGGRLALGIGLAHKVTIEGTLGIPFTAPARHMREYLDVLQPLLRDRAVSSRGDIWSASVAALGGGPADAPSLLLAAMGPRMLQLAGSRTDGVILWLSGPKAIAEQIKPALDTAADERFHPSGRIVASVPVCVTDDEAKVRDFVARAFAGYNDLPSYRGVMDAEGAAGPADVAVIGTAEEVRVGIQAFADAGTTDFAPVELGSTDRERSATRELLVELATAA